MRRTETVFFVAILMTSVCAQAQQASSSDFLVTFDGIIMHTFPGPDENGNPRTPRALVIEGDVFTKRHYPTLVIQHPDIDVAALRDATGQAVSCTPKECRVPIIRYAMRIGTEDKKPAPDPLHVKQSFNSLTPHMKCVTNNGGLQGIALNDLPEGSIAGSFELNGGSLCATAFSEAAFFVPDYDHEGSRPFSEFVTLRGTVHTGSAVLQILSYTSGEWIPIARPHPSGELDILVLNHSHAKTPTSAHFVLNHKLMVTKDPFPVVCADLALDQFCQDAHQHLDPRPHDPICFPEPSAECNQAAPPGVPAASMASASSHTHLFFFEATAGCANTQWP